MRLIDADYLKELIQSKSDGPEDIWDTMGVLNAINSVPTAVDELKEAYREGYHDGHLDGYTKAINEDGAKCENPKVIFDACDMNLFDPEKENKE